MVRAAFRAFVLAQLAFCGFAGPRALGQTAAIPAGSPLRIQVDHRYRVRKGVRIEGRLIVPVYRVDHEVLPANTQVSGIILGSRRVVEHGRRTQALLNGDFSPPTIPELTFNALRLPGGRSLPISTSVEQRDANVVRMRPGGKRPSLIAQAKEQIGTRKRDAMETLHKPNLVDRLEKWVYGQLPWHPRMIWTGTQYDAELTEPLDIPEPHPVSPLPIKEMKGTPITGVLDARLTTGIDSASARKGMPVTAVVTRPLLTADRQQVLLPEGAQMDGFVTQARPARWFARNGKLRFTFHSVEVPGLPRAVVHGQITAAETAPGQNTTIDEEGGAQATSGPGKYLAPMALGVLTAASYGDDAANPGNSAVISNGFGLVARVVAMSAANAAVGRGFAYFALSKSIWYRWIAKGHEVTFPKDTLLEISLHQR